MRQIVRSEATCEGIEETRARLIALRPRAVVHQSVPTEAIIVPSLLTVKLMLLLMMVIVAFSTQSSMLHTITSMLSMFAFPLSPPTR